jgi:rare lipoprotein A
MRRRLAESLAVMLAVASLGAGAASGPNSSEAAKVKQTPASTTGGQKTAERKIRKSLPYQVGTASWYGDYFQGKPTASGEPFDMRDLTAAHPTLPLGTLVRVTNLRNGKSVVLRINDRGPVVDGRIIDVSYNAARVLGFKEKGLQKVRLDLLQTTTVAQLQPIAKLN